MSPYVIYDFMPLKTNTLFFRFVSRELFVWLFFALLVSVFYGSATELWWTHDDTQILKQALQYDPVGYFFSPLIWRELSLFNFTPLVTLSFDCDISLFGLNPRYFYVHQLSALFACCVMMYTVLCRWLPSVPAVIGPTLFLIGVPVALASQQLMVRHYIEGFFLFLLSLYCFSLGLRRRSFLLIVLSTICFLGAALSKEIYVSLALLLPILPEGKLTARFKYCLPFFLVFGVYLLWRLWMIGSFTGGYGADWSTADTPRFVILYINRILDSLFRLTSKKELFIVFTVFVIGAIALIRHYRHLLAGIYIGIVLFLPMVTIPIFLIDSRHVFLMWGMISIGLAFALSNLWRKKGIVRAIGVLLILLIGLGIAGKSSNVWRAAFERAKQVKAEGRFFLYEAKADDILRKPAESPWYFEGLRWLNRYYYGHAQNSGKYFYDDIFLCETSFENAQLWSFSQESKTMVNITALIPTLKRSYCSNIRSDTPLTVYLFFTKPKLTWIFGPHTTGEYAFILGRGEGRFDVPPSGSLRINVADDLIIRIRYESSEGWVTYSIPFRLSGAEPQTEIRWERK